MPQMRILTSIGSSEYFEILFDDNQYDVLFENIRSKDFLHFTDLKPYGKRLQETWGKTDLTDFIRVFMARSNHRTLWLPAWILNSSAAPWVV